MVDIRGEEAEKEKVGEGVNGDGAVEMKKEGGVEGMSGMNVVCVRGRGRLRGW